MQKFPGVLDAIREADQTNWELGDALLAECGPHDGERGLKEAAKELAEHSSAELSVPKLARLRRVAEAFPPNRRYPLPWKLHEAARSPRFLDLVVRLARRTGQPVTKRLIEAIRQEQHKRDEARKVWAYVAARRALAAAESEEREIRQLARQEPGNERAVEAAAERVQQARANVLPLVPRLRKIAEEILTPVLPATPTSSVRHHLQVVE